MNDENCENQKISDFGIFNYENKQYVYDINAQFCMDRICYKNGCNCNTCTEYLLGECNIDEVENIILDKYYTLDNK